MLQFVQLKSFVRQHFSNQLNLENRKEGPNNSTVWFQFFFHHNLHLPRWIHLRYCDAHCEEAKDSDRYEPLGVESDPREVEGYRFTKVKPVKRKRKKSKFKRQRILLPLLNQHDLSLIVRFWSYNLQTSSHNLGWAAAINGLLYVLHHTAGDATTHVLQNVDMGVTWSFSGTGYTPANRYTKAQILFGLVTGTSVSLHLIMQLPSMKKCYV